MELPLAKLDLSLYHDETGNSPGHRTIRHSFELSLLKSPPLITCGSGGFRPCTGNSPVLGGGSGGSHHGVRKTTLSACAIDSLRPRTPSVATIGSTTSLGECPSSSVSSSSPSQSPKLIQEALLRRNAGVSRSQSCGALAVEEGTGVRAKSRKHTLLSLVEPEGKHPRSKKTLSLAARRLIAAHRIIPDF